MWRYIYISIHTYICVYNIDIHIGFADYIYMYVYIYAHTYKMTFRKYGD